ncbi:four-carbon acid sugar kinase family protein [Kineococcus terrestris]|uniref:four-carbon acid sugar kinase family protein n=1 Tax=Kineococcus terrestris TaxID=2044856 RepID=UPI0034DB3A2B
MTAEAGSGPTLVPRRAALGAVLADDLSGAAEVAGLLLQRGHPCTVLLGAPTAGTAPSAGALVVDLDSRTAAPAAARAALTAALAALAPDGPLAVKLDSLWRGNVGATVEALRGSGFLVVVAGALPALRRTVVDGVPLVGGVPLAATGLWHLEPRPAPVRVADLLAGAPVLAAALADVRSGRLPRLLARAAASGRVVVADAETDADLAAVAGAAAALAAGVTRTALAGSAALVGAVADAVGGTAGGPRPGGAATPPRPAPRPAPGARGTVVVAGSASAATAAQTTHLLALPGAAVLDVDPEGAPGGAAPPAGADPLVLRLTGTHPDPRAAADRLAGRAAALVGGRDLVLTGGETARAVLVRLGVDRLHPVAQLSHGAVAGLTGDGRLVATKPGSFGGPAELHDLVRLLRRLRAPRTGTTPSTPAERHLEEP